MPSLFAAEEEDATPAWTVHTDVFEGPLDLLLYLVKRDGIDVTALRVAEIADAYLEFVDRMRGLNLSIAGDYLVMAATLVHLKSLEILPRLPTPVEEDEPDPREAFAQRLRDYQRYKEAAEGLGNRPILGRDQFARVVPDDAAEDAPIESPFDVFGLLDVYRELLAGASTPEPQVTFEERPHLDMGEAVIELLRVLESTGGRAELTAVLGSIRLKAARVITFIGVLEMLKLGWVSVQQDVHLGPIAIEARIRADQADLRALQGFVETA
ncbi:MAG: segregation/condensation protein A [Alphaproteobacteria bacterium]|nr:segregation/condensation protein A [Myxococcales bacterium]MCB9667919.1 segregation/condensation protein A [Alphaproteobacteria bacterium]MCB9690573.1 segregation/condensation protein A [Alphaproteobacteria bacterium]